MPRSINWSRCSGRSGRCWSSTLTLGGIAIAERHARGLDEHERILAKTDAGCRFFVTQAVYARDPLDTSLEVCERIFLEVWAFARKKGLPLGVNVESVSIRKAEIEASAQLVKTLRAHMQRSLGAEQK